MSLPEAVRVADAPALAALHACCFAPADAWSADSFRSSLVQAGTAGWKLEAEGRLLGFILTRLVIDEVEILTFAVDPAQRQQGYGRQLLRHALQVLAGQGAARAHLEVAEDNAAALALYQREGFEPVGRRSGYYPSGRSARLFSRSLTISG